MGLGKKSNKCIKIASEWREVLNDIRHTVPCDGCLMPWPSIGVNGPCKTQNPDKVLQTLWVLVSQYLQIDSNTILSFLEHQRRLKDLDVQRHTLA